MDLALNNLQVLICHKIKQPTKISQAFATVESILVAFLNSYVVEFGCIHVNYYLANRETFGA